MGGLPTGTGRWRRPVGFVCVVQTAATERSARPESPSPGQFDRVLVAVGAGSLLAGFTGSFPVNASPPRTAVVAASGGRSQPHRPSRRHRGAGSALGLAGLLRDLPQATLGAVLVFVATKAVPGT